MSTVVARAAGPGDAAPLSAFWRDQYVATFGGLYRSDDLQAFLAASYNPARQAAEIAAPGMAYRLAERGDHLVGACQVGPLALPITAPAGALELKRLYVIAAEHGAGLAQSLMDWALAHARAAGAPALYLGVYSENARAKAFYARNGFAKVGEYGFKVGAAVDQEWILARDL